MQIANDGLGASPRKPEIMKLVAGCVSMRQDHKSVFDKAGILQRQSKFVKVPLRDVRQRGSVEIEANSQVQR
jgi:hypothetical protein